MDDADRRQESARCRTLTTKQEKREQDGEYAHGHDGQQTQIPSLAEARVVRDETNFLLAPRKVENPAQVVHRDLTHVRIHEFDGLGSTTSLVELEHLRHLAKLEFDGALHFGLSLGVDVGGATSPQILDQTWNGLDRNPIVFEVGWVVGQKIAALRRLCAQECSPEPPDASYRLVRLSDHRGVSAETKHLPGGESPERQDQEGRDENRPSRAQLSALKLLGQDSAGHGTPPIVNAKSANDHAHLDRSAKASHARLLAMSSRVLVAGPSAAVAAVRRALPETEVAEAPSPLDTTTMREADCLVVGTESEHLAETWQALSGSIPIVQLLLGEHGALSTLATATSHGLTSTARVNSASRYEPLSCSIESSDCSPNWQALGRMTCEAHSA